MLFGGPPEKIYRFQIKGSAVLTTCYIMTRWQGWLTLSTTPLRYTRVFGKVSIFESCVHSEAFVSQTETGENSQSNRYSPLLLRYGLALVLLGAGLFNKGAAVVGKLSYSEAKL